MRATSREAWEAIQADGTLGERQRQAFEALVFHGPVTGQELAQLAISPGLWKRLSELKTRGLIQEAGKRTCRVTGRTAIVWEVKPRKPEQMGLGI